MAINDTRIGTGLLVSCLCLAVAGCGGTSTKLVKKVELGEQKALVDQQHLARQEASSRVGAYVQNVETRFAEALEADLKFYAPESFGDAQKELAKLRELYKKYDPNKAKSLFSGVSEDDLRKQSDQVEKLLNHGLTTKRLVDLHLGEVLRQFDYLGKLTLPVALRQTFDELRKELSALIAEIEDEGEFKRLASARGALMTKTHAFEVRAMLAIHADPLVTQVAQLDKTKIPKSAATAAAAVTTLSDLIRAKPRALDEIQQAKATAEQSLRMAAAIYTEVQQIQQRPAEDVVIWYRSGLDRVSRSLLGVSFDDRPFEQTTDSVIAALQAAQEKALAAREEQGRQQGRQAMAAEGQTALAAAQAEAEERQRAVLEAAGKEHALALAAQQEQHLSALVKLQGEAAVREALLNDRVRQLTEAASKPQAVPTLAAKAAPAVVPVKAAAPAPQAAPVQAAPEAKASTAAEAEAEADVGEPAPADNAPAAASAAQE